MKLNYKGRELEAEYLPNARSGGVYAFEGHLPEWVDRSEVSLPAYEAWPADTIVGETETTIFFFSLIQESRQDNRFDLRLLGAGNKRALAKLCFPTD